MGYILGEDRNQYTLMTNCLDEYIAEDNIVRLIDAFVETLDLKKLEFD